MITIREDGIIEVDTYGQFGRRYAGEPPAELSMSIELLEGDGPFGKQALTELEAREGVSVIPPEYSVRRDDRLHGVAYFSRPLPLEAEAAK